MTEGTRNARSQRKSMESFVPWKEAASTERRQGSAAVSTSKLVAGDLNKEKLSASIPSRSGPSGSQGKHGQRTAGESPLRNLSTNTVRSLAHEKEIGRAPLAYTETKRLQRTAIEERTLSLHEKEVVIQNSKPKPTVIGEASDVTARRIRSSTSLTFDKEIEVSNTDDGGSSDVGSQGPEQSPETELQPWGIHSEEENDNNTVGSEEGGVAEDRVVVEREDAIIAEDMTLIDETRKRRERRHEQARREKEGVRCKKEGLPRNFLLVDEHTQKPYSVGVGDWRKELMLLSNDLDPAIGNINQQPESAVEEIAEWIQHTWEYSSPVKFAFVKEVIARGVTLRRADLWKRIRNEEPKPDGMSDRTWRTLERQLESAATIRKSESCSKANASRVNFGKTGPLGEVGVRERLRRQLRRSLDPEEIRFEMAHSKGYGRQYKRKKEDMNVMHDKKGVGLLALEEARTARDRGNSQSIISALQHDHDNDDDSHDDNAHADDVSETRNGESLRHVGRTTTVHGRPVQEISALEIAQHPFVKTMMERLEALEGRHNVMVEDKALSPTKTLGLADADHSVQTMKKKKHVAKSSVRGLTLDAECQ